VVNEIVNLPADPKKVKKILVRKSKNAATKLQFWEQEWFQPVAAVVGVVVLVVLGYSLVLS